MMQLGIVPMRYLHGFASALRRDRGGIGLPAQCRARLSPAGVKEDARFVTLVMKPGAETAQKAG
jgi:hypothetical protein